MTGAGEDDHRDLVALVLAIGLATALNIIVLAVLYDAIRSDGPGLSENATQILVGWGGGMIGIIGSWLGYRTGARNARDATPTVESPPEM